MPVIGKSILLECDISGLEKPIPDRQRLMPPQNFARAAESMAMFCALPT
jgi:hypothetical protein